MAQERAGNSFIRQFPELMRGKTIVYVHGFGSSAQTGTVTRLRQVLPSARVVAEDIPLHPEEGLKMLHSLVEREQPQLILGTSMGGMYAEMLYGFDRILVNPAFRMADTMREHGLTGAQRFQQPRSDGVQDFIVTKALVKEYQTMTERCFSGVTEEEKNRVFGLFGDADELVDTYDLFLSHYPQAIRFHGGHRLEDQSFMHAVVPVIRWIDDRQEQHGRKVIHLGLETLRDAMGQPRSSVQKVFRHLLEKYELYIVTEAPSCAPDGLAAVLSWAQRTFDAPAWNHVIFCNQRQLLVGDYLVADADVEDFMGGVIRFGDGPFKTWEDIGVFFDRLGDA
ncbi:MAG: esterase [Deltaproteobacteria bacterium]|nr:esterase [Deltaproteobacteria bacterium]